MHTFSKIKAGLKKVHSLCKKHLVYQVWGQFWVVALPGFKIQQFDAKTQHLEAKTQHFEAKTQHLEAKTQHFEAKIQHFDPKIQHLEAKTQDFEARMLKCKPDAAIFQK